MVRRLVIGLAAIGAVHCLVAANPESGTPASAPQSPTTVEEQPARLTLIYNVNNAGYVDVCGCKHKEVRQGSLPRRASFLKQIRATGRDVLLLDGGSSLFPIGKRVRKEQHHEAVRKAKLIVESYNRMGYSAMCVGPFDIAAGFDVLKDLEERAKFQFLSANLIDKESGKLLFTPHAIFESGGARVGVVGLTLETMTKGYLGKVAPNLKAEEPKAALRRSLTALKGKVDLVVVLSHLREETSKAITREFPGLQILIDPFIQYGNHHTWIKEHEWIETRGKTVFLRGDGQGARLGVLDIRLTGGSGKPLVHLADLAAAEEAAAASDAAPEDRALLEELRGRNRYDFQRISLEPHHLNDPDIELLVEQWKKNVDPSKAAALEKTLPRKNDYLTSGKCQSCHQKQYVWWSGTKHAHAMASLERTGDHQRFDCIGCHSLGYGKAFLDTTNVGVYAGVQCESCHGTNPQHAVSPAQHKYRRLSRKSCIVCHNKETTRKTFVFSTARRMVACPKG